MTSRNCAKCKVIFEPIAKVGTGYCYCKACRILKSQKYWAENKDRISKINRASHVKQTYGLDKEAYAALLKKQNESCAICREQKPLAVDHDHQTGKTRGLLCRACNTAIGMLKENINVLNSAISYLDSFKK